MAVGFTTLANTLLLATCVFHQWMSPHTKLMGLGGLAILWLGGWWRNRLWRTSETTLAESTDVVTTRQEQEQRNQLFREAQQLYLQNDWLRTEQLLLKLLKQDARDVESRLMLATLWRHQGRTVEALRQLDRLERLEAAHRWRYEIDALRRALTPTEEAEETTTAETNRRLAA